MHTTSQQITVKAINGGGLHIFLPVIYGSNFSSERNELSDDLRYICKKIISAPWAVMGDFNTARYTDEKMGGKPLSFIKLSPFNDCIAECQLLEVIHVGSKWSWHKNTVGPRRIVGRLERVLCNHL